ncbi:peptidoglycan editing factor PgeF [Undibacterium sp. CY21W]|uniref:peptidoglycan editing factor PgeF n=1 Tax=Undibacterium sp. CY21W TaxID=2762293 RepID=UPI00164AF7D8|nr:peptidoglycan editing factor PgeF [Undibacterium sp. CY21W]MBC3928248.1 peptidoglycan editing factor PgeF [Undibacterium sp. CY21W]
MPQDTLPFPVIQPDWCGIHSSVKAFSTLRSGGVSSGVYGNVCGVHGMNLGLHVQDHPAAVLENRAKINACLPSDVILPSQVHGNIVVDVDVLESGMEADAVVSSVGGKVCAILTADCLPVLFCDESGKVVAAAHAGWRGLASGILQSTVAEMRARGAERIFAWMGAAIGPDAFEVGQDVVDIFASTGKNFVHCFSKKTSSAETEKYFADIYQLAREILLCEGVNDIFGGSFCTFTDKENFYSYRRDGVTGRMISLIWFDAAAK